MDWHAHAWDPAADAGKQLDLNFLGQLELVIEEFLHNERLMSVADGKMARWLDLRIGL